MDPKERRGSYRDEILQRYDKAKKVNRNLTPGQFMMRSSPGVYSDEASGARAFRKLDRGEVSGERMYNRSYKIKHYKPVKGQKEKVPVYEPRYGGYQAGLWKVVLSVQYTDYEGNEVIEERSYIVESNMDSNYDIPTLYDATLDADDNYLAYWSMEGSIPVDVEVINREIVRIERTKNVYTNPRTGQRQNRLPALQVEME